MKKIEIDEELHTYLLSETQEFGESASTILRRLLGFGESSVATASNDELLETFTFLKDWESYRHLTQTKKFLHVLSWAYRENLSKFDKVLLISGSKREYFALDEKTLKETGSSTNPRPIPKSPYWVVTNNSTAKKMEILSEVFRLLGYDSSLTHAMLNRI